MEIRDIAEILLKNDNFLIITHKSPDGDTLGTAFALCGFLRDMGKKANVMNSEEFPERYNFLYEGCEPQEFDPQYVIAVDIADPQLLGSGLSEYQEEGKVDLCIDHHLSNKAFAKQTYVEPDASATALIMYKILKAVGKPVSKQVARCLYTGLATDTGCFKFENTTPEAHKICAELMEYGIDFSLINRKMFDIKSRGRIKVEETVMQNMEFFFDGACAMIVITKKLVQESGAEPAEFDGLASLPLCVEGVKIGITVKERHENVFKISVRTTDEIDASAFCQNFGGGGHIRASGCEIKGTLEEVEQKLLEQVKKVI